MTIIGNSLVNITSITIKEIAAASVGTPPSGKQYIFIDSTSHALSGKNSAGAVTALAGMTNPMTTAGDLILGGASGTPGPLAIGTNTYVLTSNGTTAAWAAAAGGALNDYIYVREEQSAGTSGGTFTSGAWRTRTINTEVSDTGGHCSIASNQITLVAGTYRCYITAPAWNVNGHKAILYNVTDSANTLIGSDAHTSGKLDATIKGIFTIAGTKTFEVRHQCQSTQADSGFGNAINFSVTEIYTEAEFWKVG